MPTKQDNPCGECSWCCEHTVVPLMDDERVALFNETWGNTIIRSPKNNKPFLAIYNPCQHLCDGLCNIYEDRPIQCRIFPNTNNMVYKPYCKLLQDTKTKGD